MLSKKHVTWILKTQLDDDVYFTRKLPEFTNVLFQSGFCKVFPNDSSGVDGMDFYSVTEHVRGIIILVQEAFYVSQVRIKYFLVFQLFRINIDDVVDG